MTEQGRGPSTMSNLDELERLLADATPGPWKECGATRGGCVCGIVWDGTGNFPVLTTDTDDEHEGFCSTGSRKVKDAALIVAAVNSLPALIAAARRAEERTGADALHRVVCLSGWVGRGLMDSWHRGPEGEWPCHDIAARLATLAEGAPR